MALNIPRAVYQQARTFESDQIFQGYKDIEEPGSRYLSRYSLQKMHQNTAYPNNHLFNVSWLFFRYVDGCAAVPYAYGKLFARRISSWEEITPQLIADSTKYKQLLVAKIDATFPKLQIKSFWFDNGHLAKKQGLYLARFLTLLNIKHDLDMPLDAKLPQSSTAPIQHFDHDAAARDYNAQMAKIRQQISYLTLVYREQQDRFKKNVEELSGLDSEIETKELEPIERNASIEDRAAATSMLIGVINGKLSSLESEMDMLKGVFERIQVNTNNPLTLDVDEFANNIADLNYLTEGLKCGDMFQNGKVCIASLLEAYRLKLEHMIRGFLATKDLDSSPEEDERKLKAIKTSIEALARNGMIAADIDRGVYAKQLEEFGFTVPKFKNPIDMIPTVSSSLETGEI